MAKGVFPRRKFTATHIENLRKSHLGKFKGPDSPRWKGVRVNYTMIHRWLRAEFGSADRCENPHCPGLSKQYEWAKKKGRKYLRRRDNFWRLCKSCHRKYDGIKKKKSPTYSH